MVRVRLFIGLLGWILLTGFVFAMIVWNDPSGLIRIHQETHKHHETHPRHLHSKKIINASTLCRKPLEFLFFIHTAPDQVEYRHTYRRTLGDPELSKEQNWGVVFFLGMSTDRDLNRSVTLEAEKHLDIVIFPFIDTYRNLTYKFMGGLQWVVKNCPDVEFVIKMDHATLINVFKLKKYLTKESSPEDTQFHCYLRIGSPVVRESKSKWYLSEEEYPSDVYPPFCSGFMIVIPRVVLKPIVKASSILRYRPIDNTYVTGDLAVIARVGHVNLQKNLTLDAKAVAGVVKGEFLAGHFPGNDNLKTREKAWGEILQEDQVGMT